MDRGKWYKACTHDKEVKQLLKPVNPQTELYEKTRSTKDCTDHGMYMCIPQIITCKMMIRSEMMCNVTGSRLQIPGKALCAILTRCSSCFWAGKSLLKKCHFVLSRSYLSLLLFFFFKWGSAIYFACSFQN